MPQTSVWKHFAAFIYDLFPIAGIFLATSLIVLLLRSGAEVDRDSLWFSALLIFELAFYYIYSWKLGGQTLGMRAWKLIIKPNDSNQLQLNWRQAFVRFIVGILSILLLGLGLFWKLFPPHNKSWMDLASDSQTQNLS